MKYDKEARVAYNDRIFISNKHDKKHVCTHYLLIIYILFNYCVHAIYL